MKPIRLILTPTRNRPLNLLLGALLLLTAALLLLSLASYHPSDPSLNTVSGAIGPKIVRNWIGPIGAYLADLLLQISGITAFGLPLWIGGLGLAWIRSRSNGPAWLRWTGVLLTLAFLPAVFGLMPWHWRWLHVLPIAGVSGRLMADLLQGLLNPQGSWIVAGVLAAAGLYLGSNFSFRAAWEWSQQRSIQLSALHDRWQNWQADRADQKAEQKAIRQAELGIEAGADLDEAAVRAPGRMSWLTNLFRSKPREEDLLDEVPAFQRVPSRSEEDSPVRLSAQPSIWDRKRSESGQSEREPEPAHAYAAPTISEYRPEPVPISSRVVNAPARAPRTPAASEEAFASARQSYADVAPIAAPAAAAPARLKPIPVPEPISSLPIHDRADAQPARAIPEIEIRPAALAPKPVAGFKLPPSTLLNQGEAPLAIREDQLREEARTLVEKCAEFKVNGQIVQINPGPMVTTYEFKPDASVKYSRVAGLGDDLCLAMRAESILIERMAGKSTIGIQVPNHDRETIHLRDVIESETFAKAKSRLTLAMGKDINGRIVTADLAGMPHVLIAGSTGSGKSVAINAMIMSLLFRTTPAQVRLILVDPKRVELGMYEGIPHLFTPIITEAKLAANALRNAVREMERRLKLLASRSVRNIDQYNAKISEFTMDSLFSEDGEEEAQLPYIVIIIDELADLMMLDRANVEESITRLAQMARAVGIHLVLATQRPSVDVITGLIKANVPTRISFRLASKVDSRTIIDDNGAESLLGRGDMLFRPPGTSRLMRLHAPYVSEKETAAVVDFWKAQGEAEYVEGFLEAPREERAQIEGGDGSAEGDDDELFDDAVRLVFEFGKASTSLLQRRLRIGYGRAAHLIDLMERDGLVGPADGSRPRELLKHPGWLHEVPAAID
jgi:S-DNA-T family DNA segregation ATPase FtsK/SpoIIIE